MARAAQRIRDRSNDLKDTLSLLIKRVNRSSMSRSSIIPWSCPVPSFGDESNSSVATLGLNPSNREFVDESGRELDGHMRRLHTLKSLGLTCWNDATSRHFDLIVESCRKYFHANPYDGWFRSLDRIISGADVSYYHESRKACHLDLIPYATTCKWTDLTSTQRSLLLALASDTLGLVMRQSPIRLLILNGRTVVENMQRVCGVTFKTRVMRNWTLPRKNGVGVDGIAYQGVVSEVAGVKLQRQVLILGFNHNIQSSFGVTTKVTEAIRAWVASEAKGVLA